MIHKESFGAWTLAFNPVGDRLLTMQTFSSQARVWDVKTARLVTERSFPGRKAAPEHQWGPNGRWVASGGRRAHPVTAWDAQDGSRELVTWQDPPIGFSVHPDGRRLATVTPDRLSMWELPPGMHPQALDDLFHWLAMPVAR